MALALFGLMSVTLDGRAQTSTEEYDGAIRAAVSEFSHGNWEEARALFRKAHELSPNARTMRGLGMVEFELRRYAESANYLSAALASSVQPLPDKLRKEVAELLARARAFLGSYRFDVKPESAVVRVDGADVRTEPDGTVFLSLGRRSIEVSAVGYTTVRRELEVSGGESKELQIELHPTGTASPGTPPAHAGATPVGSSPPPEVAKPGADQSNSNAANTPAWLLLGAGGVMVAAGITVGVLALGAERDFRDDCPEDRATCDPSLKTKQEKATRLALASDILWIGGAAVATGGLGWLVFGSKRESEPAARLTLTPSGGALTVRGAF